MGIYILSFETLQVNLKGQPDLETSALMSPALIKEAISNYVV